MTRFYFSVNWTVHLALSQTMMLLCFFCLSYCSCCCSFNQEGCDLKQKKKKQRNEGMLPVMRHALSYPECFSIVPHVLAKPPS